MTLNELEQRLKKARRQLDKQAAEARLIATKGKELQIEVAEYISQAELLERTAHLLASIGEERQTTAQKQIESLVTEGLKTIFQEDISFHVMQSLRGRTPQVDFMIRSKAENDKVVETSVLNSRGGGLVAVVSFLLRVVILLLSGKKDTLLVLDESLVHLSEEYQESMAQFIRELVDKTGIQLLMVTHQPTYVEYADKRYRFSLRDGITEVVEI